jgi:hypothetical protein
LPGIGTKDILSVLLTTEGLLFASLSISVAVAGRKVLGREQPAGPKWLAGAATIALWIVAIAASTAWADLFTGCSRWPDAPTGKFQAVALLLAIVAQPLIAAGVAWGVFRA